jgi:undecaprenyl-diphosphatase
MPVPPIDLDLIAFFNRPGEPALDAVMRAASSLRSTLPLLVLFVVLIVRRSPQRWLGAVVLLAAVGLTDLGSARVLKPYFARVRPCNMQPESYTRTLETCGSGEAMPSIHAADTAAAAAVVSWALPAFTPLAVGASILVGVSRVYLGQHWPTDVLFGWLIGASVGGALIWVTRLRYAVGRRRY